MTKKPNGDQPIRRRRLRTAAEIVAALGGNRSVSILTDRTSQHVTNWKATGKLPPQTFLIVQRELNRLGYEAPPELWRISSPK
jgi:hypothetical protein